MYKQALSKADNTAVPIKTLNNLATVEFKRGKLDQAEHYFKEALKV